MRRQWRLLLYSTPPYSTFNFSSLLKDQMRYFRNAEQEPGRTVRGQLMLQKKKKRLLMSDLTSLEMNICYEVYNFQRLSTGPDKYDSRKSGEADIVWLTVDKNNVTPEVDAKLGWHFYLSWFV